MKYTLKYVQSFEGKKRERKVGDRWAWHDEWLHQWQFKVQLEETAYWFLTVFINDDGTLSKYSLDEEAASDSHYHFENEAAIRNQIYQPGDENRLLDEILTRYTGEHGGLELYRLIMPYVTAQYHYD